jgi:CzcA family heavy metal efflux pump
MMRWIIGSSVKFRLLVVVVAGAALAVGITQLRRMPVDVLPEFAPPSVEIQTEALGLSAEEVEQLITVPMEQDLLNGVAFLKDIRSESVPGLSRILLVFDPGTDIYRARQVVAERLTQAHALPQVSKPPHMLQPLSSTNRVMMIGVSSKAVSPIQLSVLARWTIAPRLLGVPGVANVAVWGQRDRQLQVQVDPARLRNERVTLDQVIESTANALWVSPLTFVEASTPGTGGLIDTPNQRLGIQHISPITTPADLAEVRLQDTGRRALQIGDVATVVEDHQPLIGDALVGDGGGLLLVVEKFPDANVLQVTRGVEKAIDAMQPGLPGITFDTTVYRPASYIEESIHNLSLALIIGLGLAALVLAAIFFRWRTALIGLVVVPLSFVTAALVLWALGATMNSIVVVGLAAALIVVIDDVVITVENATRRLRRASGDGADKSTGRIVLEASLEVRRAAVYATLVIALAVVPLFFLNQLAGAFFPDLVVAYLLALLASMVVAVTVTPALSVLLLSRRPVDSVASPLVRRLQDVYEGSLSRIVDRRLVAYLAAGAVVIAAAAAVPFLRQSLLPRFKESQLLIRWDGPAGTSLPEMSRITALAGRELRSLPGVRDVNAHVGRAVTGDQVVDANSAELWVSIDPSADYDRTAAAIRQVVGGYPGLSRDVQTYSQERVREVLTTTHDDVVVRLYGEDLKTLESQGRKVRQALSGIDGITNARVALPLEQPSLQIRVDLRKADRYGIKPGDVRRAAATLISGLTVGNLFEAQKVFDVVVWGTPRTRDSLTSIRQLLIDTPDGGHVRLADVADVRIAPSPTVIKRQAVSRYVDVAATVAGRDRDAVVRDVQRRLRDIRFPIEYHAEVVAAETQPLGRLISIAIAAAIGMLLLLQAFFGSWHIAALAFFSVPVGVAGSVLTALAAGGKLSFGSYIGLLAVFGIATRNAVVLLDHLRRLEQEETEATRAALVLRGARERLAPILLTAAAAAVMFAPILVLGSRPGYELLHAAAVAVVGGLVTSALLNLFFLPVLYLRFGFPRAAQAADTEAGSLTAAPATSGLEGN